MEELKPPNLKRMIEISWQEEAIIDACLGRTRMTSKNALGNMAPKPGVTLLVVANNLRNPAGGEG